MRISSVHLVDVGVFDDTKIDFPTPKQENGAEIHLLTGANGSEKSTILYALAGTVAPPPMLDQRMRSSTSKVDIQFSNGQQTNVQSRPNANRVLPDKYVFPNLSNAIMAGSVNEGVPFSFAMFAYSGNRSVTSVQLEGIKEIHQTPFSGALSFHGTVQPGVLIQWIANTNSKIANAFYKGQFSRVTELKNSIQRIESAVAEIIGKSVEFVYEDDPRLDVKIRVGDTLLSFDVLPDGLKSIISWIADLLMRLDRINWAEKRDVLDQNFILFLDEIEIHLHPAWQRKILPVVQKLFRNAQIFIATHSPFVIGSVSNAWAYQLTVPPSPVVTPTLTNSANSVELVLHDIFGIEERFGVDVEKKFAEFYELRDKIFTGEVEREQDFMRLAEELATRSEETNAIISRELRQAQRILGKTLPTTFSVSA
jgi:hypothetical protein